MTSSQQNVPPNKSGLALPAPTPLKLLPAPRQVAPETVSMDFQVSVLQTGFNAGLHRHQKIQTNSIPLLSSPQFVPSWTPFWPNIQTLNIQFPDINLFQKDPPQSQEPNKKAKKTSGESANQPARKPATRIQPPDDALTLEDRLFYLLHPPLETWLDGQEMLMPFEPFPYQYQGIAWLFAQKAALLADEMGLGKTMQTITALRLLIRGGNIRRVLLVCPKPLIPNWQREFRLWAEEIPVITLEGDSNRRKLLWKTPNQCILMANYELVVRDYQEFEPEDAPHFDLVVLDEAQRIKNRDSLTSQTIRSIERRRSWTLTGTPIENRPEEMASLFEFLKILPPHANPDLRQLKRLSDQYILRRTKDLVHPDMPPRLDRDAVLELSDEQQASYQIAEKEGIFHLQEIGEDLTIQHVFELVMRLKQITNFDPATGSSCKLERLMADMEEIAASGAKAILFSQWTKTIDWLAEHVKPFGPLVYHGGVPQSQREGILDQFKNDPDKHILLMSYGTGAVGLNLQFAHYVFLYDRWWNPAVEDQAINRAHRIGVSAPVIVTRFICKETIEERIDLVLRQKRELFEKILGDGNESDESLSLTANEIFGLFDLKTHEGQRVNLPIEQDQSAA